MNKKLFWIRSVSFILGCLCLQTGFLSGQTKTQLFNDANTFYTEGKYQEALLTYKAILDMGYESGELYFNMGNTCYKLKEIGKAVLYYEKAAKYLAGDEALEKNRTIARLLVVDKIEPIPRLRLSIWLEEFLNLFSLNVLAWGAFFLFLILAIIVAFHILRRSRVIRRIVWSTAILSILVLLVLTVKIYDNETNQYAIVLVQKISVLSEPSISGTEVFQLHEGTKVRINRLLDIYAEITIADGKTGWILLDTLGII